MAFVSLFFTALAAYGVHVLAHDLESLSRRTLSTPAHQANFPFDLLDVPAPARAYTALPAVPSNCAQYTGAGQECAAEMQAFNVTLGDCGSAWTVCRCASANYGLEEAVDHLARVPVGLRRNVRTVMLMPDTSAHAYTLGGDIHYFGICSQRTWVHESTHASDHGHSASSEWLAAVDGDTCVPDAYAQSNYVEDFAQVSVIEVYRQHHGGALPPGFSADCMAKQLAYLQSLSLYANDTLFGNTCAFEDDWTDSAVHTVAPPTLEVDAVVTGSYTTLTAASTVLESSGAFGTASPQTSQQSSAAVSGKANSAVGGASASTAATPTADANSTSLGLSLQVRRWDIVCVIFAVVGLCL